MAIELKTVWTLRIALRHQSTICCLTTRFEQWHSLTTRFEQSTGLNSDAVWLKIIMCICMYCTHNFWSTNMLPRHRSTGIRIFSNGIVTPHQSMPHHRSMPPHRSVYVNSVVNCNMDNIVHVNSDIFPFMLLLRFSIVLSSKVMSISPSDLSFILKWP